MGRVTPPPDTGSAARDGEAPAPTSPPGSSEGGVAAPPADPVPVTPPALPAGAPSPPHGTSARQAARRRAPDRGKADTRLVCRPRATGNAAGQPDALVIGMLNYTDAIATLMRDITQRVPALAFIDLSQVLVFARFGRANADGPYATCHSLNLPTSEPGYFFWRDPSTGHVTRRSEWFVTRSPSVTVRGARIAYLVSVLAAAVLRADAGAVAQTAPLRGGRALARQARHGHARALPRRSRVSPASAGSCAATASRPHAATAPSSSPRCPTWWDGISRPGQTPRPSTSCVTTSRRSAGSTGRWWPPPSGSSRRFRSATTTPWARSPMPPAPPWCPWAGAGALATSPGRDLTVRLFTQRGTRLPDDEPGPRTRGAEPRGTPAPT